MSVEENDGEPLSPMARAFQSLGNDCCVVTMIGCKTQINADVIRTALNHNVSKHPRFSSKLSDDGGAWIKTKVNVEDHVLAVDFDPDKIGEDGDHYVEEYISRLTTLPLDRSKPLWDIHILNIKTSDAEAVCVIRSHHSLGDGTSLMSLLVACTQETSHPVTVPVLKRRKQTYKNNDRLLSKLVLAICSSVRLIWNTFVDALMVFAIALFLKDTKTPLKGDEGVESTPKKFYHRIVSLDDIKLIKEATNTTINDVLFGATQAALSRYLINFPGKIRLTAGVFINLRSEIGIKPLADMMAKNSKCRWGNYFSSINVPTSIGIETDPLMYISKAKSTMDRKKHSFEAMFAYLTVKFLQCTFGDKVAAKLAKGFVSNTTTYISNMIGPMEERSFLGHPIAYIAPSVYGHGHALTIHFLSYAEKMVISIAVDPKAITDPHKLCDEMEDSLKSMKTTLLERGLL